MIVRSDGEIKATARLTWRDHLPAASWACDRCHQRRRLADRRLKLAAVGRHHQQRAGVLRQRLACRRIVVVAHRLAGAAIVILTRLQSSQLGLQPRARTPPTASGTPSAPARACPSSRPRHRSASNRARYGGRQALPAWPVFIARISSTGSIPVWGNAPSPGAPYLDYGRRRATHAWESFA